MGMDVYTKSYWDARERGEFAEAEAYYEQFNQTPTALQQESRDEDWALFDKYRELSGELNRKYGHFRWTSTMTMVTDYSPTEDIYTFTPEMAEEWYHHAEEMWHGLPHVTVKNGFGRVLYEGAWLNGDPDYPLVLTEYELEALRALADLGEGGYIA